MVARLSAMLSSLVVLLLCGRLPLASGLPGAASGDDEEAAALEFLNATNERSMLILENVTEAEWQYNTNLTDHNQQKQLEANARYAVFNKFVAGNASEFEWNNFSEPVRRQFRRLTDIGNHVLDEADFNRVGELEAEMQRMYSVAKVCKRPGYPASDCFPLDPDLTDVMAKSRDYEQLEWAWKGWRDSASVEMRPLYEEDVRLVNKAAARNGFADAGDYWRSSYDTPTFQQDVAALWQEVKPLYEQLHAYVNRKLQKKYSNVAFPTNGQIPANLLGNMWAQSWGNVIDIVVPFPNKTIIDVTAEMVRQNYTAMKMFELSEQFFTSLGLIEMPETFWNKTMYTKPDDREVVCHASAWDFMNQKDFRVKQCTEVTQDWLVTTHHEMGHIEYFLQYKHHPTWFREGANPGFHEAIGDVMSLSVNTPEHLRSIGLLPDFEDDQEVDINYQMSMALEKIAFLPFGYMIDQWRWSVFSGEVPSSHYNSAWWDLRCSIQGVSPPVGRSENDFDPGAKYHVPTMVPYIRYFVSYVIQFQFHEALCDASGFDGELHRCDIFNSTAAGERIGAMMKLGSSKPWPDAMEAITGSTRSMNASALLRYFRPLHEFLKKENEGHPVGWVDKCSDPIASSAPPLLRSFLGFLILIFILLAQH